VKPITDILGAAAMRQTLRVDEPSDDALMHAYAAGDAAAFERLYARHQAGLYRFVRRLLGKPLAAQADEVFQDTWMKLVQQRGRWTPHGAPPAAGVPAALPDDTDASPGTASVRTWLYTVAHHRVVDLWRRSGREVSVDAADDAAPWEPDGRLGQAWQYWPALVDPSPSGDDLQFWRRAGERLLYCLDQLPLPQRSSFLLHHEDGLPLEDVATAVGVGFETAKTRLRYAMSKLRTCMGAYLPSPGEGWA
jgi:RNA polymerase sigma-70 factor (ECF subfamily)